MGKYLYQNTRVWDSRCRTRRGYVLGPVGNVLMIGISFGPGGWRPARDAHRGDLRYFAQPTATEQKGESRG